MFQSVSKWRISAGLSMMNKCQVDTSWHSSGQLCSQPETAADSLKGTCKNRGEQMNSTLCQLTSVNAVQGQGCVAVTWLRHGKGLGETISIIDYGFIILCLLYLLYYRSIILIIDYDLDLKGDLKEWTFLLAIKGPRG